MRSIAELFEDIPVAESDLNAAWFSRPNANGRIAWELRSLGPTPVRLVDSSEPEAAESELTELFERVENQMRQRSSGRGKLIRHFVSYGFLDSGNERLQTRFVDMMIKDFGGQIASVWEGLRPMTRNMLVGALQTSSSTSSPHIKTTKFSYDAHADWELSRLVSAFDEQSRSSDAHNDAETSRRDE